MAIGFTRIEEEAALRFLPHFPIWRGYGMFVRLRRVYAGTAGQSRLFTRWKQ